MKKEENTKFSKDNSDEIPDDFLTTDDDDGDYDEFWF